MDREHSEFDHTAAHGAGRAVALFLGVDEAVAPAVAERLLIRRCGVHPFTPICGAYRRAWRLLAANRAGLERVFEGYQWAAARPHPAGEPVTLPEAEVAMLMRGEDALDAALPRCPECLVSLDVHPTLTAWLCPSCGGVSVTS